jgi:hypothetical protein
VLDAFAFLSPGVVAAPEELLEFSVDLEYNMRESPVKRQVSQGKIFGGKWRKST